MPEAQACSIKFPAELPVSEKADQISDLIGKHQVLIIAGETGSGKTTQLPKICLKAGRGTKGLIGHTQPRRLAARSVASRIAEELETELGGLVGYQVRFTDKVSPQTRVKLMTDGILLAEIQHDRLLRKYDTLIIDEAHERSLNIDFLLGYLKKLLIKRPELKLIITSATIDVEKFSAHFNDAPVVSVTGRNFPVSIEYRPPDDEGMELVQQIEQVLDEIRQHEKGKPPVYRDVLIFLSGEREIRDVALGLRKLNIRDTEVLPLYARLSVAEQNRVFRSHKGRRIVLSTNVAETSLTVPGIAYVIDAGKARISRYSVRSKVQRLPIESIAQASANQRAGRCGRICPGICYRLYSEEDFIVRPEFTDTEIRRTNLASVILKMLSLGLGDISDFPFIDKPDSRAVKDGMTLLQEIGAVNAKAEISKLGRKIAQLPVDPKFGRIVIAAAESGCLTEILIIVSALSIQDPRERPLDKQQASDQYHKGFADPDSDFMYWVNLWNFFENERASCSQNQLKKYCQKHFLSFMRMREWRELHRQLRLTCKQLSLKENSDAGEYEQIHQALLTGLIGQVARYHEDGLFLGVRNRKYKIFPGSVLARKQAKWIVSTELVETTSLMARTNARVEVKWIEQQARHLLKHHYFEPHWEKKPGRVMAYEKVSLYGLDIIEKRKIPFSTIDRKRSREIFIEDGLAGFNMRTRCEFYHHNKELVDQIEKIEDKTRRRDILVNEQKMHEFYDAILPDNVFDVRSLERWFFKLDKAERNRLKMNRQLLLEQEDHLLGLEQFPDTLKTREMSLDLDYAFAPGKQDDGISVTVPVSVLKQLKEEELEWMVPGVLRDKCIGLIKALPKNIRKNFVPVPDTVDKILQFLNPEDGSLKRSLVKNLRQLSGHDIPLSAWDDYQIDSHLKMNILVTDEEGKILGSGRELKPLVSNFASEIDEALSRHSKDTIEQNKITEWNFGDLEKVHQVKQGTLTIKTYPAIVDKGTDVSIQLLDNADKAVFVTERGVARLLVLKLNQQLKPLKKSLLQDPQHLLAMKAIGSREYLLDQLIILGVIHCFGLAHKLPYTAEQFTALYDRHRADLFTCIERFEKGFYTIVSLLRMVEKKILTMNNLPNIKLITDIQNQLKHLVHKDFLSNLDPEDFLEIPRYLKAALERLEKYPGQVGKDQQWTRELTAFNTQYSDKKRYFDAQEIYSPELDRFKWMLEEYRVSLFAQHLGTRFPISAKRLNRYWESMP